MPLLWMVAIDLLACFADLLDDDVLAAAFDDPFDLRLFVAGNQDEAVAVADDASVLGWSDVDRRHARRPSTLAVEAQRRLDSVLLGALLDPLVDVAEDLLVASSAVGEVHVAIIPAWPAACPGRDEDRLPANKKPWFPGLSSKRMMGLEPTTFCMRPEPRGRADDFEERDTRGVTFTYRKARAYHERTLRPSASFVEKGITRSESLRGLCRRPLHGTTKKNASSAITLVSARTSPSGLPAVDVVW